MFGWYKDKREEEEARKRWLARSSHVELLDEFLFYVYSEADSVRMLEPGEAYQEQELWVLHRSEGEALFKKFMCSVVGRELIFDITEVITDIYVDDGEVRGYRIRFNIAESILPVVPLGQYPIDKIKHTVELN